MVRENIVEFLDRAPFLPFRLVLSSGGHYDVVDAHGAALLKSEVFVVFPDGERWAHVPMLHIAAIEILTNGRKPRNTRRKPR